MFVKSGKSYRVEFFVLLHFLFKLQDFFFCEGAVFFLGVWGVSHVGAWFPQEWHFACYFVILKLSFLCGSIFSICLVLECVLWKKRLGRLNIIFRDMGTSGMF